MTTTVGRPSRAQKPRAPISTRELLAAVAEFGSKWTYQFGDREIVDVIEAVDREQLAGNLLDGVTLSPQAQQLLTSSG